MLRTSRPRTDIASIRSSFIYYVSITTLFFFNDDLSFENNLYIIKYVMIVIIIMDKIILKKNVENSNSQPYPANDLTIIIPTFVLRNCYYSLMKPIQSFVSHYSTDYEYSIMLSLLLSFLHVVVVIYSSSMMKKKIYL